MTRWQLAAGVLTLGLVPCGMVVFSRRGPANRLVGLEMAAMVETLVILAWAEALNNPNFDDLAVALALLAFGAGLVFTRFLERWL